MSICVQGLQKKFNVKKKSPGFSGSLKSLLHPEYEEVSAVNNVSFQVHHGEILAFLGPNGAGKSTIIKMLTGLLYPTDGKISVLGLDPWQQRRELSLKIGSVFGQKAQLWYHLPPIDTFKLLSKIYELDTHFYKQQLNKIVELFELEKLLYVPVRKLSLGQRMKCEVAASLLHAPELIFLDEPTIGLDVIAKNQIRDALKIMNKEENTTIFLTSHDTGDVESLCERVIVVNHGDIIFNDSISKLKQNSRKSKILEVRFQEPVKEISIKGIEIKEKEEYFAKIGYDTDLTSFKEVTQSLMDLYNIADISLSDPPLEETIKQIYSGDIYPQEEVAILGGRG
ncbi:ABC transporter ATP-binding protein [Bacillus tropicus]|uniref:ABC transporter ATP-binding protein n=1 Tax=Bacillus tropicus TaxID=2026188 RepID=UPI00111EC4F5|nr:ATP-binding cassette domain-containing protein [Bacillus tropicus]TNP12923.1 ATP-binding cassette domain-containing protein [Bacillus tropicus]